MPATAKVSAAAKPRPLKAGDHVFLVDGSSYIFRAYFAMFKAAQQRGQKLTRSDGLPIGGVLAFSNMLWKMLREGLNGIKPTHIAAVFDYQAKTFRNDIYPEYKANRDEPPDELIPQFPLMRDAVRAFGLIPIEQEGYEADDIIATYARQSIEAGADATIVAGDKDLMQLVRPGVAMFDPMPGRERPIGVEEVIEKFGVPPAKVPEVQALIGDSTDNVPGVPGIGVKTAAQLINEYGDLETLLKRASEIKQEKRRQSLIEFAEQARLSKRLVLLDDRVKTKVPLDRLCLKGPNYADRLPQGDGIPEPDKARVRTTRHRRQQDRARRAACGQGHRGAGGRNPRARDRGHAAQDRFVRRAAAGQTPGGRRQRDHAGSAGYGATRRGGELRVRAFALRHREPHRFARRLDCESRAGRRARAHGAHHLARSDAG
jgi:5'-3' exonuclease